MIILPIISRSAIFRSQVSSLTKTRSRVFVVVQPHAIIDRVHPPVARCKSHVHFTSNVNATISSLHEPDTLTLDFLMIGKLPTGEKDGFQCRYDRPFDRRSASRGIRRLLCVHSSRLYSPTQLVPWIISRATDSHLTRVRKCPIISATRKYYRLKSTTVDYYRTVWEEFYYITIKCIYVYIILGKDFSISAII